MIIVPKMIGSMVGVYNGKTFNQIEIKPEMIGHYLAEFSISYKPVKHGRPGIGTTHSSRFIPLKWKLLLEIWIQKSFRFQGLSTYVMWVLRIVYQIILLLCMFMLWLFLLWFFYIYVEIK